jgi:hypothetical protein
MLARAALSQTVDGEAMAESGADIIDVSGAEPTLSVFPATSQVVIACRLVEHGPDGPRLTERQVRLGMTLADAMALHAQLSHARSRLELPEPGPVTMTAVPPAKDRN